MQIHCCVSSAIMIPRRKDKKFLHCGSVECFLRHGSIEDYVDPILGIKNHIDVGNRRGEVPTP